MEHSHNTEHSHSCCEPAKDGALFSRDTIVVCLAFMFIFAVSFLPVLSSLNQSLIMYIGMTWWAILLGFVIGGLIDHFIPEQFIYQILGQKKKRTIFLASLLGFLMAACSHGILAISMQLYKKGASIPAVITFLMAAPWANLPVTIMLFVFFGWKAIAFILAAMFISIVTGFIFSWLEQKQLIEQSKNMILDESYKWKNITSFNLKDATSGVLKGALSLADMVLWWILIGITLSAIIRAYVPSHIFMQFFGPSLAGLLLTLVFATVIEVCSEGSSPIAFEIFNKVGTLGNPFVFLMAGVATDYTEIGLIWTNIGKKTAIWLPIVSVPLILIFGILFNLFL